MEVTTDTDQGTEQEPFETAVDGRLDEMIAESWDRIQYEDANPPDGAEFASDLRTLADRYESDADRARDPHRD